ncbi:MAG: response regulator [Elusimicrobiota bacterium]
MECAEILVVDDEVSILELFHRGIAGKDFKVTTVLSGEEADAILRKKRFDIVVTDVQMDPPNGLQLAKTIRERWPRTDVIIVTGYPSMDTTINALKYGAYDFIVKPLDLFLMKTALKRCVEHRTMHARLESIGTTAEKLAGDIAGLEERLAKISKDAPAESNELERDACRAIAEQTRGALEQLRKDLAPQADEKPKE